MAFLIILALYALLISVEVSGESASELLFIVVKKDNMNKKSLDFIVLYFIDFTFIT